MTTMPTSPPIRVLIAEDEYLASLQLRDKLEQVGYVVVGEAADGEEAVAMTASLRPDIVIMDVQMTPIDGLEAAQRIRRQCPTPVVMLTAYQTPDLLARANAVGASAYLTKPSNSQELQRTLEIARSRFSETMALRREKQVLIQEILHRTRNNMQVMLSLLELQSMQIDDHASLELLRTLRNRIQAMALVHEHIYTSDATTVNLANYLRDITKTLWSAYAVSPERIACHLDVEPVTLPLEAAVPFGLVAYEVLNNALKHAFPGDATGEIHVCLRMPEADGLEFRLLDTGCGFSDAESPAHSPGLGLKLVNIILRHQFSGHLDILHHAPGTELVARCTIPRYARRIKTEPDAE